MGTVIVIAMGALTAWAIATEKAIIRIIAVIGGKVAFYILGKIKVKEVIEDDRHKRIDEKASKMAITIFGLIAGLAGTVYCWH